MGRLIPPFDRDDWEKLIVSKIEKLEAELNQKTHELNEILNAQNLLYAQLVRTVSALKVVENRLDAVTANIKNSSEYIYKLKQENMKLKLSSDEWMKRSIQLQFKVLSTRSMGK
jgi:septation ring formation regulator EzrA